MSEEFDTIVGKVCVERGWVTRQQLVDCIKECSSDGDFPASSPSARISDVLVAKGFVKAPQIEAVRKEVNGMLGTSNEFAVVQKGDASLGQVLVKSGAVTKEQLLEALSIQQHEAGKSGSAPRLGELLIKKGYATFEAIEKAIQSQKDKTPVECPGCGAGYLVVDFNPKRKYLCRKCAGTLTRTPQANADMPREAAQAAQNPKNLVGKYVVSRELGRGGMGAVYKAWDRDLKRWVALKVLMGTGSGEELARFRREAQTAASLRHPNIVGIYEVDEADGRHVIAMEYVDGRSLAGQKFTVLRATELLAQIARAVDFAHSKGIVHRDIKPHNVMIDREGSPFVMDFGLAKSMEGPSNLTMSGTIVGTPSYMAPEQAEGKISQVGRSSDVYSLGAVLYEALTGRPPFRGKNPIDTLRMVVEDDVVPPSQLNPAVTKDLDTVVLKCLEKDRQRRYASAKNLAADLKRFSTGKEIRARRSALPTRFTKQLRQRWVPFVAAGASALALLLILILALSSDSGGGDAAKAKSLLEKAERKFEIGRPGEALPIYEAARELDPGNPVIEQRIIACQKAIKAKDVRAKRTAEEEARKAEAARKMKEAARLRAQPELDAGRLKIERGRRTFYQSGVDLSTTETILQQAIAHFSKALGIVPDHHEAFHLRGQAHALLDDLTNAEKDFTRAIRIMDTFAGAYYDRGRVYIDQATTAMSQVVSRGDVAREEARAYRERAKADLEAYRRHGGGDAEQTEIAKALLAFSEQNDDRAVLICDQLIARKTSNEEVYKLKGDALLTLARMSSSNPKLQSILARAQEAYTQAIARRVNYFDAYLRRGSVRSQLGDVDGAMEDLAKSVPKGGRRSQSLARRSQVFLAMGRSQDAMNDLRQALALKPSDPSLLFLLSGAHYLQKNFQKSIQLINQVLAADPRNATVLGNRGIVKNAMGDARGAIQDFLQALNINPRLINLRLRLGGAYYQDEQWKRGEESFTTYLSERPGNSEAHFYRGACRNNLRNFRGAIEDWERCIVLNPAEKEQYDQRIRAAQKFIKD